MDTAIAVLMIIGAGVVLFSLFAAGNIWLSRPLTQAGHRLHPRLRRQATIPFDSKMVVTRQASVLNGFPTTLLPVRWFALTPDHIIERGGNTALVIERAHVDVVHLMLWQGQLFVVFRGASDRYRALALGPVPVDRFMNDLIALGWPVAPQEIAAPLREVPEGFRWWASPAPTDTT